MRKPADMTEQAWALISRLPSAKRDRVLERATIIYYGGGAATLPEADEMALAEEGIATQQAIGGGS